jgi:hypothetical protein
MGREIIAKAGYTFGPPENREAYTVKEPCSSQNGRWFCVSCMTGFPSNLAADLHSESHSEDYLTVWWCNEHGPETATD